MRKIPTVVALAFCLCQPARAQDNGAIDQEMLTTFKEDPAINAALYDFEYGNPVSPVLPLIGVEADQITKVDDIRRFAVSLLTGAEGDTGPAIGIDLAPFWLLANDAISLSDYRSFTPLQKIATRTKISAAATTGDEAAGRPSGLVFSMSSKLLAAQDPLADNTFEQCIRGTDGNPAPFWKLVDQVEEAGVAALPSNPADANQAFDAAASARLAELKPALEKAYTECTDRVAKKMAGRGSLDVGAGIRFLGDPGDLSGLAESGIIAWATYGTGTLGGDGEKSAFPSIPIRAVLHGRFTFGEAFFGEDGALTGHGDSFLLAGGLESVPDPDGNDVLRWNLQVGWTSQEDPSGIEEDKDYWRYLANASFRIAKGVWLRGTLGRTEGRGIDKDTYILFGLSLTPGGAPKGMDGFYSGRRY